MEQELKNTNINIKPVYALVTGAQGGIGRAIVKKLIEEGTKVIAVDLNAGQLEFNLNRINVLSCDINNEQQIKALWEELAKQKIKIDSLINNAGIYPGIDWQNYDAILAQNVISTNVIGSFLMSQQFARQSNNGAIVNISSVSAFTGSSDPIYGASKAALIGLTKSLALAFAPHIRVNAIAPSIVDTPMLNKIPKNVLAHYQKHELISNVIEASAIAEAVIFLNSAMSRNITGSTLDVNNGVYMR